VTGEHTRADTRYEAVRGRDERFDGVFFTAVLTTGVYCRPSCPATTPKRENVRFYPSAAAAHRAGAVPDQQILDQRLIARDIRGELNMIDRLVGQHRIVDVNVGCQSQVLQLSDDFDTPTP